MKTLSYLSPEEQQKYKERQSVSWLYQKPPGMDAADKPAVRTVASVADHMCRPRMTCNAIHSLEVHRPADRLRSPMEARQLQRPLNRLRVVAFGQEDIPLRERRRWDRDTSKT